ncbi:MAG: class I SAM-dependent methyltransferase [Spirochaetota bacterium]
MNYADSLFDAFMYPLEAVSLASRRRALIPRAGGDVLELGVGTGANLPHYDPQRIRSLTLTDLSLSPRLRDRAEDLRERTGLQNGEVHLHTADAEDLPYGSESFDTVVFTLVFCSVPDQSRALGEVRRVLRPGGRILFVEHVRPHGPSGRLVDHVNPLWHAVTRECNINRDTAQAIRRAGFRIEELRVGARGFLVDGVAVRPVP